MKVAVSIPDRVTATLDALTDTLADEPDDFMRAVARRVFNRTEW